MTNAAPRPVAVLDGPANDVHPPSTRDYLILADFRRYLRRFLAFSESITNAAGLSPARYQALLALRALSDQGIVTPSLLAEQLSLKLNTVVELVDRLEAAGYVSRSRISTDRRLIALSLTERGAAILAPLAASHLDHHRTHLGALIDSMSDLIE